MRTARWRGWRGGFLLARPGLSKWFWAIEPVADQDGLVMVDLEMLSQCDELNACQYLSGVLGLPLARVAAAMGVKHIYGPHHNEVQSRLERAQEWGTAPFDLVSAEESLREHLARVSPNRKTSQPRVVWDYPPPPVTVEEEDELTSLYGTCLARRVTQVRASSANLRLGVILADAARSAREAVGKRTGTAWLWERSISWFMHDAAWIGIGGDWSSGAVGNPFSPARKLYAMGVSFYLVRSVTYIYAATD